VALTPVICGRRITLDNLGAIVKLDKVEFVCDESACLYGAASEDFIVLK